MKWFVVRVLFVVLVMLALLPSLVWAATGEQPLVPTWPEFWAWMASAVFVIPLLELLKKLQPPIGEFFDKASWLIAALATVGLPLLSQWVLSRIPDVNVLLWTAIYCFGLFGIQQLLYRIGKKSKFIT
jgi:energy-converting hydrogenase Eha subunit A